MCPACEELHVEWGIRTPAELGKAIRVIQAKLADGTLRVRPNQAAALPPMPPFETLQPSGPWGDVLAYGFSCRNCGGQFTLVAETYHGSGGIWQPVAEGDGAA